MGVHVHLSMSHIIRWIYLETTKKRARPGSVNQPAAVEANFLISYKNVNEKMTFSSQTYCIIGAGVSGQ